jgi:hypothetical protein
MPSLLTHLLTRLQCLRRGAREDGQILVEALIMVSLIVLTSVAMSQVLPLELSVQRSQEDRAQVSDIQDGVSSWANSAIAPAELPLDNPTDELNLSYHLQPSGSATEVCYHVQLDPVSHQLSVNWDDALTEGNGYQHCPTDLSAHSRVIAQDVVNSGLQPLFNYYASSDESSSLPNPSAPDPSCVYPSPTDNPAAAAGGDGNPNGTYRYAVAFTASDGTTDLGPQSASVTVSNKQVDLTAIPTGPFGTEGRALYRKRTSGGDGAWHLVTSLSGNTQSTYTDDSDNATVEGNDGAPSATALAAGRCAKSLTLKVIVDFPGDRVTPSQRVYRVLMSDATTSQSLANAAVTAAKVSGPLTADLVAGSSIGSRALSPALTTVYDIEPLVVGAGDNYAPATSTGVGHWQANTNSPAAVVGATTLAAGDGHGATIVNWSKYCRSGLELEARGHYTLYNPTNASVTVGVRLAELPKAGVLGPTPGAFATAAPQAIASGEYETLTSAWRPVDFGSCAPQSYLIGGQNPFLYRLETNADAVQAFTVTNAFLELRWTAVSDGASNQAPLNPAPVYPADDALVTHPDSLLFLAARFLDPDPSDNGHLHFELCAGTACATPLGSGRSSLVANGGLGTWSTQGSALTSGHTYYWRVRGEDSAGALGPWTSVQALRVP